MRCFGQEGKGGCPAIGAGALNIPLKALHDHYK
jgi:hypothetical protein